MAVTKDAVFRKIRECDAIGVPAFLEKYNFQAPRGVYLLFEGCEYPARAIWGSAHNPPLDATYDNARMYNGPSSFFSLDSAFYLTTMAEYQALKGEKPAIQDLDDGEVGNDDPEYKKRMAGAYIRSADVRRKVIKRANGTCEYGGCKPFTKAGGDTYLETHHVISLSEQGTDKMSNVIALCANHHREAHFGERWKLLQDEFLEILDKSSRS